MENNIQSSENKDSNNIRLKHALCYIPIVAFVFFFTEKTKTVELMKHIKYGGALFVIYIVLNALLSFIPGVGVGGLLALLYVGMTTFLAYKAYNGEKVELEYIDQMESKIKETMDDNKPKKEL